MRCISLTFSVRYGISKKQCKDRKFNCCWIMQNTKIKREESCGKLYQRDSYAVIDSIRPSVCLVKDAFHLRRSQCHNQKRRAIRSSRNQTNRIGRKISIQWKLDCRSHKPLDGLKSGIMIGCLFRFCMRRRQSCFSWFISIGVLSGIARK